MAIHKPSKEMTPRKVVELFVKGLSVTDIANKFNSTNYYVENALRKRVLTLKRAARRGQK